MLVLILCVLVHPYHAKLENLHFLNDSIVRSIERNVANLEICKVNINYLFFDNKISLHEYHSLGCEPNHSVECIDVIKYDYSTIKSEVDEFRNTSLIPHTLSLSTPGTVCNYQSIWCMKWNINRLELGIGLVGGKKLAKTWSKATGRRWAIPDDHFAQNRKLCYDVSIAAGEKVPS